jgi:hypothetical protein
MYFFSTGKIFSNIIIYIIFPDLTNGATDERVQIDWQWPLPGVYSNMMVNSAHPGEGGVCVQALPLSLYAS